MQTWLNAIDASWQNLPLNDALKAGRAYVKYHLLFSISAIIATISGQPTAVPDPAATAEAASRPGEVLPLAANCLENAMQSALNNAQVSGKVFSPQNWLKNNASVQSQMLVAGTIAGMLPNFPNGPSLIATLKVPSNRLAPRWAAD